MTSHAHSVPSPGLREHDLPLPRHLDGWRCNTATSPRAGAPATFTPPRPSPTDTTVADFGAGTTGSDVRGRHGRRRGHPGADRRRRVRRDQPARRLVDRQLAGWGAHRSPAASAVDGRGRAPPARRGSGRAVEFAGTFSGDAFQNAGFGVTFERAASRGRCSAPTPQPARCRPAPCRRHIVDQALGAQTYIGPPHRFRIEWDAAVRFYVDGTLVHTAATVAGTMRPIASDFARAAAPWPSTGCG